MSNLSEIDVAILAGGLGTRLEPILPGRQKVVAKVKKYPFLEYILNQLNKAGFKNVVMCTGYLGDQVEKAFGGHYENLSLYYSREQSPLGTGGAVRFALPLLESDNILVINGDSFLDIDLNKFLQFHIRKRANGTIALTKISDVSRYGSVELDKNNLIVGFEEKKENRGVGFIRRKAPIINGGIYLFKRPILLEIPENKTVSFEKEMFPKWIRNRLYGFKVNGRFIDIGTPESYKEAQEFFSRYEKTIYST